MMIDTKEVIERTKEVLKVNTQQDIAKYFNVSSKAVSDWKNGNAVMPYHKFIELAEKRGINLNWFFFGMGDKYINTVINNGISNHQVGDNNHFYLALDHPASENEQKELKLIASLMEYAPRAYLKQVIEKLQDFKKQCMLGGNNIKKKEAVNE